MPKPPNAAPIDSIVCILVLDNTEDAESEVHAFDNPESAYELAEQFAKTRWADVMGEEPMPDEDVAEAFFTETEEYRYTIQQVRVKGPTAPSTT